MLMLLNILEVVQAKPTIDKEKQITPLSNYWESHLDEVTYYSKSDTILHIYYNAYYLS